jgi:hypothetical protein
MPGDLTFPPGFPTVDANNVLTISRFLNSPALIERRLRTLVEQRFISDVILSGRGTPAGGAIMFEVNESIFADRAPLEPVNPGGEFPVSTVGQGPARIATVSKWGLDTEVTLEDIMRLKIQPVNKAFVKLTNTVVRQVDSVGLVAIQAAVTQTQAATAAWGTSGAKVLLDLATAKATVSELNEGYMPDTIVMSDLKYAVLISDEKIQAAMAREDKSNPVYTGQMGQLVGMDIMVTSNAPDPTEVLILDRTMLGGQADERPFATDSEYQKKREKWWLRALRATTPWISEPACAVRITGT